MHRRRAALFSAMLNCTLLILSAPVSARAEDCIGETCAPKQGVEECTGKNCLSPPDNAAKECIGESCLPVPGGQTSPASHCDHEKPVTS